MQGLTGMRYDAVDKTLFIDSKIGEFTAFLSTASGFGTVAFKGGKAVVNAVSGTIQVLKVNVGGKEVKS